MKTTPWQVSALLLVSSFLPGMALASGGGGEHHAPDHIPQSVWFHAIDLALLIGILYYVLRAPLRDYLAKRQDGIREALFAAERAREEAEAKAAEYTEKLRALEVEARAYRVRAEAEAKQEAERLIEGARQRADAMKVQSEKLLAEELRRAREELRAEVVSAALELAREMIRESLTPQDQERLLTDYVATLHSTEVN